MFQNLTSKLWPCLSTLFAVVFASTIAFSMVSAVAATTPQSYRMLGEYSGYNFPADINSYTTNAGRKPDMVMWFQSWDEPLYYSSQMSAVNSSGITPLITWSPGSNFNLTNLNNGSYDTYIQQSAQLAKSYNKPMFIRMMHEMNGSWQSFAPGNNGNTSAQFVSGWQRVVNIFRQQGVTNVSWVWSPNIYGFASSTAAFDPMYPGDNYVDWTGLDGYNSGSPWAPWRSMATIFGGSYDDITALTSKPLMIAEWGTSENGGDKASWIQQSFFTDIPNRLPLVRAVVSFNVAKTGQGEADWRINSSAFSLSAYQAVVASPLYGGPQPVVTPPVAPSPPDSSTPGPAEVATTNTGSSPKQSPSNASGASYPTSLKPNVTISLAPQAAPVGSSATVTKVRYYVDGQLLATVTKAPYQYNIQSHSLPNGEHHVIIITSFSDGTVTTLKKVLLVNTAASSSYFKTNAAAGIVVLLVCGIAALGWHRHRLIGRLIQRLKLWPRRLSWQRAKRYDKLTLTQLEERVKNIIH